MSQPVSKNYLDRRISVMASSKFSEEMKENSKENKEIQGIQGNKIDLAELMI